MGFNLSERVTSVIHGTTCSTVSVVDSFWLGKGEGRKGGKGPNLSICYLWVCGSEVDLLQGHGHLGLEAQWHSWRKEEGNLLQRHLLEG